MKKRSKRLLRAAAICLSAALFFAASCSEGDNANITGVVRADGKPLSGVRVSDGVKVVSTDARGRYRLESDKRQGTVFIVTPSGYVAPCKDGLQPGFWAELTLPAEEAERHDFELRSENQDSYTVLFLTDMHLTNSDEKHDLAHFERLAMPLVRKLDEEYRAQGPVYSFNLGDFSHELYWYQYDFNVASARDFLIRQGFPTPLYSIPGNHDNDGAVTGDDVNFRAGWLYRQTFGPEYYSMDIGGAHWIMLDNIIYKNTPGEGKANTGIAGARNYDIGFTDTHMEWLRRDLEFLTDDTPVYVCTHAPLLFYNRPGDLLMTDHSQMDSLARMFGRFGKVTVFSGHAHKMLNLRHEKYPVFEQYVISATSGNMWTTSTDFQTLGTDGADAGILAGTFSGGAADYTYHTEEHGVKKLRAYDMNSVGDYYRTDPGIRTQREVYSARVDYGDTKFRNHVLVNYWCYKPGETVEMYEDGNMLEVSKVDLEDPLYNISYYVPIVVQKPKYKAGHAVVGNPHMFSAKAGSGSSPVEIRIKDASGEVVHSEVMTRPKGFGKDMP